EPLEPHVRGEYVGDRRHHARERRLAREQRLRDGPLAGASARFERAHPGLRRLDVRLYLGDARERLLPVRAGGERRAYGDEPDDDGRREEEEVARRRAPPRCGREIRSAHARRPASQAASAPGAPPVGLTSTDTPDVASSSPIRPAPAPDTVSRK